MVAELSVVHQDIVRRAIQAGKLDTVQLWFRSDVLDRYRANPDCRILRSNSAGRLKGPGNWLVNFGISPDDSLVHLAISSLAALPELDQGHWLGYLVNLPAGENFLRMSMNPTACIDDGESRDW